MVKCTNAQMHKCSRISARVFCVWFHLFGVCSRLFLSRSQTEVRVRSELAELCPSFAPCADADPTGLDDEHQISAHETQQQTHLASATLHAVSEVYYWHWRWHWHLETALNAALLFGVAIWEWCTLGSIPTKAFDAHTLVNANDIGIGLRIGV